MKRTQLIITVFFIILYLTFLYWYYKPTKSFSANEIDNYTTLLQRQLDESAEMSLEDLMQMVEFMKSDNGKSFYNINIVKYREQALYPDDIDIVGSGKEANARYSKFMMKEILSRACHPIVFLKPTINLMGNDKTNYGQIYWDDISIIRYRSRRDFMEVITSERFKNGNVHKWAGIEDTLVYPAQGIAFNSVPIFVFIFLSIIALIITWVNRIVYKKKQHIGILTARAVIFILVFIHLILPYTPVNRHEGIQIPIGAGVIGVWFLVLALKSYRYPRKYFIFALAFFWGVTLLAAVTRASPIMEGIVIKLLFSFGLLWGIWQCSQQTFKNKYFKYNN